MMSSKYKEVKCYYCEKNIKVSIFSSTFKSICFECKKIGRKSPMFTPESLEKKRRTFLNKYGVDHPSKTEEVKEKIRDSHLENYRNKNKSEKIERKRKKTCLEKYGVDNPFKDKKVKEKIKNTNKKKYGVDNPSKSEEVKSKMKEVWLKKYGVDNPSKSEEVKNRKKQTFLDHFGVECSLQDFRVKEKIKKTCLKKYNVDYISRSKEVRKKIKEKLREKFIPILEKSLLYLDLEIIGDYVNDREKHKFRCTKCGTEFIQIWQRVKQGYLCPNCFPRNTKFSKGEKEISKYIESILPKIKIIENTRTTIPPYELDIYIPGKKIAIEFDGLFWHSEDVKIDHLYHLKKTKMCQDKEIKLIHIFEDEWIFKQDIVKERLKQILRVSDSKRVHARECEIKEIDPKSKNNFLEKFHLQGRDSSKIKLGAFYKNKLISVMTFSKPNLAKGQHSSEDYIWELNRFCSDYNYHIPGIASKLLTFFKKNYNWKEIFSYADRRWSDGNLYYKLGFNLISETKPNYWYIKDFQRIHRFNLRKRPDEPKDIPEWVLRSKEGYTRIWDCGNFKFIVKNN